MKIINLGDKYLARLNRGEELISSLNNLVKELDLESAWISGLGAADKLTIGYYDFANRKYHWFDYGPGTYEVINITGNLSFFDDEPIWHLHGMFSDTDCSTFGGHIKSLNVSVTLELLITSFAAKLERQFDEETGLNLIN